MGKNNKVGQTLVQVYKANVVKEIYLDKQREKRQAINNTRDVWISSQRHEACELKLREKSLQQKRTWRQGVELIPHNLSQKIKSYIFNGDIYNLNFSTFNY